MPRPEQFECSVLLPPAPFATDERPTPDNASGSDGSLIAIAIPCGAVDLLQDLRNVVLDSAEGFWLGSFAFARVPAEDAEGGSLEPDAPLDPDAPCPTDGSRADVPISSWTEVGVVFDGPAYADLSVPRVLRVVDAPADELEVRTHVARVRDVLVGTSAALVGRVGFEMTPYDPSATAVDAGLSVYAAMRASSKATAMPSAPVAGPSSPVQPDPPTLADDSTETAASSAAKKRRSGGKGKGRGRQASAQLNGVAEVAPAEDASALVAVTEPVDEAKAHAFAGFDADRAAEQPLAALVGPRAEYRDRPRPPSALARLTLSPWNPPPAPMRLRGHLLYLTASTLEGATLSITATPAGYVVDQSDDTRFNPIPRPPGTPFSSLFSLLLAHSPRFESALRARFAQPPVFYTDAFASAGLQGLSGAAPWLVDVPTPPPDDALRHQLAYLSTGSLGPTSPAVQREWNEEFVAIRELPRSELNERLVRDRLLARLCHDFSAAAARAVVAVARGEVQPLNPNEPPAARTYVASQILLLPAEDAHRAMTHLGGDEAVRATTAKDVAAIRHLNSLDIEGLHTTGTVVVDFMGERWTAQAVLPGLLGPARLDPDDPEGVRVPPPAAPAGCGVPGCPTETGPPGDVLGFKIVYGCEDAENAENGVARDDRFHALAAKVAEPLHLALHTVTDVKGKKADLWLASDVKGVIGTDGRSYLIDLYRMQCVDVCFLETDLDGPIVGQSSTNGVNGHANGHANGVDLSASTSSLESEVTGDSTAYPHRIVLLRNELVAAFRGEEFKRWLSDSVAMKRGSTRPGSPSESEAGWQDVARRAQAFKPRGDGTTKAEETSETDDEGGARPYNQLFSNGPHAIINLESFRFALNPDAFVTRKHEPGSQCADEAEREAAAVDVDQHSTLLTRAASLFLRETVIPELMTDMISSTQVPQDGRSLTKTLHARGINMRYLGRFADVLDRPPEISPPMRNSAKITIAQIKACVIREMISRGAKHVFRRLLRSLPAPEEAAPATSHFLNCFVGRRVNPSPRADTSGLTPAPLARPRTWHLFTPASLQRAITLEVERRFRYSLPESTFTTDFWPVQTLREFCLRVGLQLRLREYPFTAADARGDTTTFAPEDVVNFMPVVKDTPHKAVWLEEYFDSGVGHFNRGNIAMGEQTVNEALAHFENVYGAVHPELATRFHELAVVYHQLAQPLNMACSTFENGHAGQSSHEERQKAKAESGLEDAAACEAARRECRQYLESALRMNRQSTIVCERVFGLDAQETLNYYIDLAILEHANDNPQLAIKLSRHALALSHLISGPAHGDVQRILGAASQMLNAWQGPVQAIPLHEACCALTRRAKGDESIPYAQTLMLLARALGNSITRDFARGVEVAREAAAIFRLRFGPDEERTKDAETLAEHLAMAAARKERGESSHVSRMARLMRTDESRVREIIARNNAKAAASASAAASNPAAIAASAKGSRTFTAADARAATIEAPSLAHLDIDELVERIEGPKPGGKPRRAGRR